ncbi:DUF11 domain-containing protein [Deinococcus maricopensis]|uniref:Conserved repeat domain protein n=1 Tax=Deinococcus maricopensis (strain DSM 21211 / LMG 22137 / NRRL B-23946 / LB-34) TaxID=709986 RepID=E8UBZ5_DEIML|nr:DUF11 domain-containing protein [Deinococcus maricopensis]ADV68584.1 conserved repeat domain protein [Deinococcus maricopensis DSM 21211]
MSRVPHFIATLALALSALAGAVGTPAGTSITNQASGQADPFTPGGPPVVSVSNIVQATVQPVCAVSVTPDGTVAAPGQAATVLPGERAVFPYRAVNVGNTPSTFNVSGTVESGSAHTPALRVVVDANGNGTPDANESDVTTVTLDADASANLLLIADTTTAARGDAFVNLVAACTDGTSRDANNVARVSVGEPPALSGTKTFTPATIAPGATTTVTLTARNDGTGAARELTFTDPLGPLAAQGLTYVTGSAVATGGTAEFTSDGVTWTTTETAPVTGIRLRTASLAPGATATLTFSLRAAPSAEGRTITNTATLTGGPQDVPVTADLRVQYSPAVALGPVGNPTAPEGTSADTSTAPFALVGQATCLDHTLQNTGDVTDDFTLQVALTSGAATTTLLGADGQPLAQPVRLAPGASITVRVCYTPTTAAPISATITATGARGTTNATTDLLPNVVSGLPELTKTADATGTVGAGDTVTYTLTVRNPYPRALTNVTVRDDLDPAVQFVSASDGGTLAGRTVTWTRASIGANTTVSFTLAVKVAAGTPDGAALRNTFTLTSAETPAPTTSNEVVTPVWSARLILQKDVDSATANYGDRLNYTLTIRNTSPTTAVTDAIITDTLPAGLTYIPGTTTLQGQPFPDPEVRGRDLIWRVGTLPASSDVRLTYATRVTAEATEDLVNTVVVQGAGGNATGLASNRATARTRLTPQGFAPLTDLVGVVYVDRNRDGVYQQDVDLPLERARVILAGGRIALTDRDGRYHFRGVPIGAQALRLDPNSVPYAPLDLPEDGDLPGTRTVYARGLTAVDFPLAPLAGDIEALRRTTLTTGPLTVQKDLTFASGVYTVRLTLRATQALPGFTLQDPLPAGATLQSGQNTLTRDLSAGETTLTYRFTWTGEPRAATTDPTVSWRY